MAQGCGGTGDDGKKDAKRHETAEQHECAESGFVGDHGVRERPPGDGGKDPQHESYHAPPIGTLRILEGARGDPSRRGQEDHDKDKFVHIGAFEKLRGSLCERHLTNCLASAFTPYR